MFIKNIRTFGLSVSHYIFRYGILIIFLIFLSTTFGFFYEKSYDNQDFDYLRISGQSIKEIVLNNYGDQLPFWFLLVKAYTFIFGKSEIILKIFPVLIFLLSAFVLYKLCEIYKVNKYLVPSLYLFNPLLLTDIAYPFKHWSFLFLTSMLTLFFFEKFKITNKKRYFLFLILSVIAGIYSNLIFLTFLYVLIIYFLVNLVSKQIKIKFFISFLIILLIVISPLSYYYHKAEHQLIDVQGKNMEWGTDTTGFNFIKESLSIISGVKYLESNYNILSIILASLILLLIVLQFFQKKDKKVIYLKLWLVLTVFFVLIIMMIMASQTPVRFRYFALAVPFFYLAIFPQSKKIYVISIGIVLLFLTIFSSIQATKDFQPPGWKEAASFLKTKIKDDSQLLLLYKFQIGPSIMDYYLNKPVKLLKNLDNPSILSADDIWLIRVSGDYNEVYSLYPKYHIEEFNDFPSILLIHLTKREIPPNKNYLILNNPLIDIIVNEKKETCQFSNGAISSNCYDENENWQRIRLDKITSNELDKICLFVHPRNDTKINLIYENIKLNKSIVFTTGLSDSMVIGDESPVYMDVYINNILLKRIINPDIRGWLTTEVDTSKYENKSAELKIAIYADDDKKRHFCFDAKIIDKEIENDYFYRNIKNATATIENQPCNIYQDNPIWPHNETMPPFLDSKIFERWDCEKNLVLKNKIWNTVGKSYAVADNEFKEAIWFHPTTNKVKSLEYKNINLEVTKIIGFYGLNDYAILNKIEATLIFTITANGEKIYEDKFSPEKGWKKFEIPFDKKLENVAFSITTTNNSWNHFFFNVFLKP